MDWIGFHKCMVSDSCMPDPICFRSKWKSLPLNLVCAHSFIFLIQTSLLFLLCLCQGLESPAWSGVRRRRAGGRRLGFSARSPGLGAKQSPRNVRLEGAFAALFNTFFLIPPRPIHPRGAVGETGLERTDAPKVSWHKHQNKN